MWPCTSARGLTFGARYNHSIWTQGREKRFYLGISIEVAVLLTKRKPQTSELS